MENKQYSLKYVIIGDTGVGKTNIIYRFNTGEYGGNLLHGTIGSEISIKYCKINNINLKLEIWDTTGISEFESIRISFYKYAACIIIVYDISNKESLESVSRWIEECNKYCSNDNLIKILVGNKCDKVQERKITEEDGKRFQKNYSLDYFYETSALNGYNIDIIFKESCKHIYELMQKGEIENLRINQIERLEKYEDMISIDVNSEKEENINKRNNEKSCPFCGCGWCCSSCYII